MAQGAVQQVIAPGRGVRFSVGKRNGIGSKIGHLAFGVPAFALQDGLWRMSSINVTTDVAIKLSR